MIASLVFFVTGCCGVRGASSTPRRRGGRTGRGFGRPGRGAGLLALAAALAGCSGGNAWREVPIEGTELMARFPCHPSHQARQVDVAGQAARMTLAGCEAGGVTYGVATVDVVDPARVEGVLAAMVTSAAGAVAASAPASSPLLLPGATPYRGTLRVRLAGRRSDGRRVEEALDVFALGTRVFQATAVGETLSSSAVTPFQEGLAWRGAGAAAASR